MNQDQEPQLNTSEAENEQPDTPESGAGQAAEAPAQPAYTGKTPGELLREGRERRELSLEDIVTQTRMSMETVRALEEDRDPPQNAWVYVRGYYRKYARALGLSEDEILEAHERYVGGAPAPEPISAEWAPADVSPRGGVPRFVLVLIAGILFGGLAWWLLPEVMKELEGAEAEEAAPAATEGDTQSSTGFTITRKPAAPAPSQQAAPRQPEEPEPAAADAASEAPETEEPETADAEVTTTTAGEPEETAGDEMEPGAEEAEVAAPSAETAADPHQLLLKFTERSWVNVVDASGRKLLDGIVQAGSERALSGQPPYRVFLGYAPGVAVSYGGRLIDTEPHTSGNNTARFSVGGETPANP